MGCCSSSPATRRQSTSFSTMISTATTTSESTQIALHSQTAETIASSRTPPNPFDSYYPRDASSLTSRRNRRLSLESGQHSSLPQLTNQQNRAEQGERFNFRIDSLSDRNLLSRAFTGTFIVDCSRAVPQCLEGNPIDVAAAGGPPQHSGSGGGGTASALSSVSAVTTSLRGTAGSELDDSRRTNNDTTNSSSLAAHGNSSFLERSDSSATQSLFSVSLCPHRSAAFNFTLATFDVSESSAPQY